MENRLLDVAKINVFYKKALAIRDVSLQVSQKKITAVVGLNGSGKTTLLNAISRLVPISGGDITFFGKSLARLKPEEVVSLGISHVPEGRKLYRRMTVLENLELGAYHPDARLYLKKTLQEVFQHFPLLKNRVNQIAGSLSGGEQQMLAIGRSLMAKPILLMMDEPTLGLAPLVIERVIDTIRTLNQSDMTILLVEQNSYQALSQADFVYVMSNGLITLAGDSEDLLNDRIFCQTYMGMAE